jgi:hypothetical protein
VWRAFAGFVLSGSARPGQAGESPTALGPGDLGTGLLRGAPSARSRSRLTGSARRPGARWTSPDLSTGGTRTNEPSYTPATHAGKPRGQSPGEGQHPDPHAHDEEHQGDAIGRESLKEDARR